MSPFEVALRDSVTQQVSRMEHSAGIHIMRILTDVSTVILGAEEGFGPSIANGGWRQS